MMHAYSSDHGERIRVLVAIGALSLLAAWLLSLLIRLMFSSVPWWVEVPSVLGFFALIRGAFDRWFWRIAPLRRLSGITSPDLNGNWTGKIVSSYSDHTSSLDATLTVAQTWTRIQISLQTTNSISYSRAAAFVANRPTDVSLIYEYLCEPRSTAIDTMHTHRGTAELHIKAGGLLEGDYYTGRDRQTYGSLNFQRDKASKQPPNPPKRPIG